MTFSAFPAAPPVGTPMGTPMGTPVGAPFGGIPTAILDGFLDRLTILFLAGAAGDLAAARQAALHMLAAHGAETGDELRLAAKIVSFSLHALEALSQAAIPEMPLTRVLRLRGSAVSLSREAHKAERRLDKLQRDRRAGVAAQPAEPAAQATIEAALSAPQADQEPAQPRIDNAVAMVEATRTVLATTPSTTPPVWSKAHEQRMRAQRITENLRRNAARHAATSGAAGALQQPG